MMISSSTDFADGRGRMRKGRLRLYEQIAQITDQKIRNGEYPVGGLLPSENQLARFFSCNPLTVSRALQVLEDRGQIRRQRGRGTIVTANGHASKTLLYIGEMEGHLYKNQFLALCAQAQQKNCKLYGLAPPAGDTEAFKQCLLADLEHAQGAILQINFYHEAAPLLQARGLRFVTIGHDQILPESQPGVFLVYDTARAIELAVDHLAAEGHRRIGLVTHQGPGLTGPAHQTYASPQNYHYRAYRTALYKHGIETESGIGMQTDDPGELVAAVRALCSEPGRPPTALVCDMDYRAHTLGRALASLGRQVPRDLSLTGIGDTPWAEAMTPPLSSVNLRLDEIAELALGFFNHAPSAADREPLREKLVLRVEPRLILRQSVAHFPAASDHPSQGDFSLNQ
ncbi:MAG: substrate-binding domain-containing protein [Verrucomicrobia bacterium]|nr:substrate-binding domain-containing protein [Verrucomicrobiota bacterium]